MSDFLISLSIVLGCLAFVAGGFALVGFFCITLPKMKFFKMFENKYGPVKVVAIDVKGRYSDASIDSRFFAHKWGKALNSNLYKNYRKNFTKDAVWNWIKEDNSITVITVDSSAVDSFGEKLPKCFAEDKTIFLFAGMGDVYELGVNYAKLKTMRDEYLESLDNVDNADSVVMEEFDKRIRELFEKIVVAYREFENRSVVADRQKNIQMMHNLLNS